MRPLIENLVYEFGEYALEIESCMLFKNGKPIPLTQKSAKILLLLIQNQGEIVSREKIIEECWEQENVEETALIQHIYRIRKALNEGERKRDYIETVFKVGYKFIPHVRLTTIKPEAEVSGKKDFETTEYKQDPLISDVPKTNSSLFTTLNSYSPSLYSDSETHKKTGTRSNMFMQIIAALFIFVFVIGTYYFLYQKHSCSTHRIETLAILPFKQIGEHKDEKLGSGMADTLGLQLNKLNKISILPSGTKMKTYKREYDNPAGIGKKLGADAVLIGTIQRENEIVRVTVQILCVENETPIWSDKFDTRYENVFTLQDKVYKKIAEKLPPTDFILLSYA